MTNLWYDNEFKIARKKISDSSNESSKLNEINAYKTTVKMNKRYYINRK